MTAACPQPQPLAFYACKSHSCRTRVSIHHAVGIGAVATFGYKGAADAKLPITVAPKVTENGKGGTVRSRL